MDLTKISNSELSSRLLKLARTERKITHLVLWHVLEFQTRRIYLDMGYSSMITYLVKHLGYCETSARNRVNAAQLLKKAPEVVEKIEAGSLNLSQLNQVQRHLRQEQEMGRVYSAAQTQELLQKLENQNTFETQKTLAVAFDVPLKMNTIIKPQKDNSVRIEMTFTEEQFAELEKARQLLAHICPDGHWPDVIAELAKKFNRLKRGKDEVSVKSTGPTKALLDLKTLDVCKLNSKQKLKNNIRHDLNQQEKTNLNGKHSLEVNTPQAKIKASIKTIATAKAPRANRPYISIKIKRAQLTKANHQCEYVDASTRLRCDARHALQIDHIKPLALGGSHAADNFRILCRAHNQLMALKWGLNRKPAMSSSQISTRAST